MRVAERRGDENDIRITMQAILIVTFTFLCSVIYGLFHDQVTVRISIEYFTIGHPPLFSPSSPTMLAVKWGITATWWMGVILGGTLAFFARSGSTPPVSISKLIGSILCLMGLMFACAIGMGLIGYGLGYADILGVPAKFASRIPPDRHAAFIGAEFMHDTSYLVALVGGWGLLRRIREFRCGRRVTIGSCRDRRHGIS